ncbi:hypothetical protein HPB50_001004 [Hyalomma asiaticum]|uniref:Uncharacterized protein n=1 Tax=Hyalomma asiaticum TaxID=266040 RepID=A0ACB7SJC9_HYAAI|nr:hypothetical protein HPB50_001004 [Hyalomma asiaticum]
MIVAALALASFAARGCGLQRRPIRVWLRRPRQPPAAPRSPTEAAAAAAKAQLTAAPERNPKNLSTGDCGGGGGSTPQQSHVAR